MTNYFPKILITGGSGQLAQTLVACAKSFPVYVVNCTRAMLDINVKDAIDAAILKFKPDILVNTAAYTAVDKAEIENDQAMQINYHALKNLSLICKKHTIPIIHLSTDYVFDGLNDKAFKEEDVAHPLNVYGMSKLRGEEVLRENYDKHLILRVSGLFGEFGHNFFKTILKLSKENHELKIVNDQITCPTYTFDIAQAIFTIINDFHHYGTYHFCSDTPISWYEFSKAIVNAKNTPHIHPIESKDYSAAAKRPRFSVLNCEKIKSHYGITQPSWQNAIKKLIQGTRHDDV